MTIKRLLAVDLGASGGKCFVGSFAGDEFSMEEIHRFAHEGVSYFVADREGGLEERTYWDDTFIYRNILSGLQTYCRDVSDQLDSIGLDTWGADGQFMSPDGDMLGKVYCYRDHRLDNMVDVVKSRVDPGRIYEITGIHFQPFNLSNQLHWFVTHRRDLLEPGCFYLPIPSVFTFALSGCRSVDSSWASVTQLMDARKKEWSREILDSLEIPLSVMPEIVEPGTVQGSLHEPLAASLGLNRAAIVAAAAHDTASAFAAAPVEDTAKALIVSSGTWSLLGKLVPAPITTDAAMAANISNEGGVGNIRCLKNCMGTWLAQELRRGWAVADGKQMPWSELVALAETAEPFQVFIDPDDPAFYNPADMETAILDFCGTTGQAVPEGRGALMRLVYESLALKYRAVNEQICSVSATETDVVNIVGGGSKNEMLNRFTANALGLPVMAGPEEATAVGNLMVQAMGLGIIPSLKAAQSIIRKAFPIREYQPEDTATWEEAYNRFRQIVP